MRSEADRRVERAAAQQYGVITRAEAYRLGHSKWTVDHRVATGRLIPLYPTVFALAGTPSSWHRDLFAATAWTEGCASHRAAARLFDLPGVGSPPIEITAHGGKVMPHSDVLVHHTNRLPRDQLTKRAGIPTTSIERTLLDLGAVWPERNVAIAMDAALRRHLTTLGNLDFCLYLTAGRGRRGCAVMRRLMKRRVGLSSVPETPLETLIFELLSQSPLPDPEPQVSIFDPGGEFVARPDFLYREFRLAIEGHSMEWHTGIEVEASDARRHQRLLLAGYRVIYVTYRDVVDYPTATLMRIEGALREEGWRPGDAIPAELEKKG